MWSSRRHRSGDLAPAHGEPIQSSPKIIALNFGLIAALLGAIGLATLGNAAAVKIPLHRKKIMVNNDPEELPGTLEAVKVDVTSSK